MRINKLHLGAGVSLFIVPYLPLFFIMCFVQLYTCRDYLNWKGISVKSLIIFFRYFDTVSVIGVLSLFGIIGLTVFLKNIKRRYAISGRAARIIDIKNENNESISYLFTCIIPFVFQDLSTLTSVIPIAILLTITALIYVNSSMIPIGPTISINYTLYQVTYLDLESDKKRTDTVLAKSKYLRKDDPLNVEDVGPKFFYAESHEE